MPGTVRHPTGTSVTSDRCAHLNQRPRVPRRAGRTFPVSDNHRKATSATPDPPRAAISLTEGDFILGSVTSGSAIGTLLERATSFVALLHLPGNHGALAVQHAMTKSMSQLPEILRQALTWDQGIEMSNHIAIAKATDLDIYFCDPHSPWQRGSNENTNGLLRQYFPTCMGQRCRDRGCCP